MKTLIFMLFLSPLAFADTAPFFKEIFTVDKHQALVSCEDLVKDYFCQSSKMPARISLVGGEGSWFVVAKSKKKVDEKNCLIEIDYEDKSKGPVQVSCDKLQDIQKAYAFTKTQTGESTYVLNPKLREVHLSKDGAPSELKAIYELKDSPNKIIGALEIALDPVEARNSESKKLIKLSYPNKSPWELNSQAFSNLFGHKVSLPVIRKDGPKYLVEIGQELALKISSEGGTSGMVPSSWIDIEKFYTWIDSASIPLTYKEASTTSPLQEAKFSMTQGENFKKGTEVWTSFKVFALYPDFDSHSPEKFEEFRDAIPRKKVFLREIFLPVLNEEGQINFWPHWEPGC